MSPVTGTRLEARTDPLPDPGPLVGLMGEHDLVWLRDDTGFVARGVAATVHPRDVRNLLADARVEDHVVGPGTGPIAVGALPFAPGAPGSLVVPREVVARAPDGRAWRTVVENAEVPTPEPRAVSDPQPPEHVELTSRPDHAGWRSMVQAALAQIRRGEIGKVVLAREVQVHAPHPFAMASVLRALHDGQPGCYVFAVDGFVGASPELLVRREGDVVTSRPMAGSVPADGNEADAERAISRLLRSGKDRDEHRVVVEAVVETLLEHGVDVTARNTPDLVRLDTVAHLATTVSAHLDAGAPSALELARALHPTPAVGGTPRDRAVALIGVLEPFDRGPYAGPVGWVDARGDGEWAVALRCGRIEGDRARCYAGAGIVRGSDPDREWDETEAKLAPMLSALGAGTQR